MPRNQSTALPVAYVVLRILIVLNWVYGAMLLALLSYTFVNEQWTFRALGIPAVDQSMPVVWGMRHGCRVGSKTCNSHAWGGGPGAAILAVREHSGWGRKLRAPYARAAHSGAGVSPHRGPQSGPTGALR